MAKKNQKVMKQQNQQPSEQPITPAKPVELTDEELGQVVGGFEVVPAANQTTLYDLDANGHA